MNIPETSAGAVRRRRLSPRRLVQLALPPLAALGISALYLVFRQQVQELALLGYGGLFAACLAANSTVLLPASSTLFTASASMALDPVLCCLIGAAGAAAGEQVSYWCGRTGAKAAAGTGSRKADRFAALVEQYGALAVMAFAFLPLPLFDLVGLACGAAKMPLHRYIPACFVGKLLKMACFVLAAQGMLPVLQSMLGV